MHSRDYSPTGRLEGTAANLASMQFMSRLEFYSVTAPVGGFTPSPSGGFPRDLSASFFNESLSSKYAVGVKHVFEVSKCLRVNKELHVFCFH